MRYRIDNGSTRGKAFKVFGGTEVVKAGEEKTVDLEGEVTETFIEKMKAGGVLMRRADGEGSPQEEGDRSMEGYAVVSKSPGWFVITLDGEPVTKAFRKGDLGDFETLSDEDKTVFVELHPLTD